MAQIKLIANGQVVNDFAVNGTEITVAGLTVDAAEHQSDSETVLEIRTGSDGPRLGGDGDFLAHIHVPAARYIETEGEGDEGGTRDQVPLDPNEVLIILWPTV